MARGLWVFDLDDTLMHTNRTYDVARKEAVRFIRAVIGQNAPSEEVILAKEHAIDRGRTCEISPDTGRPYFYCKDQFPRSLSYTYRCICEELGCPTDPTVCDLLEQIGYSVFDSSRYANDIKLGARELLIRLTGSGDTVVVLTKGDAQVQKEKIDALYAAGLRWDQALIVESNKGPVFRSLLGAHWASGAGASAYSVGDNYESDIIPAIVLGYRGVWIDVYSWETDHKHVEHVEGAHWDGVRIINELTELL